jgi:hypothetical protein
VFQNQNQKDSIVKKLGKAINPSKNTNPFNHETSYIKLYTSLKDGTSKDVYGQLTNPQYLDDVFNFATSLPVLTRTVRVELYNEFLHMYEVEVLNYDNVNVALNKNATQSSTYQGLPASNAVDGKFDTVSHTNKNESEYHI